jgi:glioma pathogenesis-related protein 2
MKPKQMIKLSSIGLVSAAFLVTCNNGLASGESTIDLTTLRENILTEHNTYRSKHHSPTLTASNSLHKSAQKWADYLAVKKMFEHSDDPQVGENIYVFYGQKITINAKTLAKNAVGFWYSEVANYNYLKPGFSDNTSHFTQVIWKNTTKLGCGVAKGTVVRQGRQVNAFYVVCQYSPAGNSFKQFAANVLKP